MNEIRFVSTNLADDDNSDEQLMPLAAEEVQGDDVSDVDGTVDDFLDYEFHEFQLIPREDFIAALRAGLFGTDVCGLPAASGCCPGGGGGAGGGGGGGGGGGAGGLGAALLGAGIGAAIGGAGGSSSSTAASPFEP